ncbi:MAG: GNAT family N-acetyltransferase [Anaerorhabdus sp.]|uniref:GNAT family N-acetyltransferase n=1 Tax=Anaerorhabdus sp. TaxID=1872524 RepID=UPI003A88F173
MDEHHQGKGLAKLVLPILLEKLYKDYAVDKIFLSVYETNELAIHLYEKLGFKFNGELDINNERVMVKSRS